jgi:hypothetical protein
VIDYEWIHRVRCTNMFPPGKTHSLPAKPNESSITAFGDQNFDGITLVLLLRAQQCGS